MSSDWAELSDKKYLLRVDQCSTCHQKLIFKLENETAIIIFSHLLRIGRGWAADDRPIAVAGRLHPT